MSTTSKYIPPDDPSIEHYHDQAQAEALDLVRQASSVFLVAVVGEGEEATTHTLAYGSPVDLPAAVQDAASTYLREAVSLLLREGLAE